jgi:hypothetical protein
MASDEVKEIDSVEEIVREHRKLLLKLAKYRRSFTLLYAVEPEGFEPLISRARNPSYRSVRPKGLTVK